MPESENRLYVWCYDCDRQVHVGTLGIEQANQILISHRNIPHVVNCDTGIFYHSVVIRESIGNYPDEN